MQKWFLSICVVVLLLSAVKADAQEVRAVPLHAGTISVSATGEEKVMPDVLQLDLTVSAGAELGGDAAAKYRDTVKRAKESLENQGIEGLKIEDRGMTVSQQPSGTSAAAYAAPGGAFIALPTVSSPQPAAPTSTSMTKTLRLTVGGIDQLSEDDVARLVARLLDAATDAGATPVGSAIYFVVADPSAARKLATKNAFAAAKENAEHLASLAEVKLGRVAHLDVHDNLKSVHAPISSPITRIDGAIAYPISVSTDTGSSQTGSPIFKPLTVSVTIRAQFFLQPDEKQQ